MEKNYVHIAQDFVTSVFGKTIGLSLFESAQSRAGVEFAKLSPNEQYDFLEKMLFHIYDGFYPHQKIKILAIQLFLRYARFQIAEKVEIVLRQAVEMSEMTLSFGILEKEEDLTHIHGDAGFSLYVQCTGTVQGGLLLSIQKQTAILVTRLMQMINNPQAPMPAEADPALVSEFFANISPGILEIMREHFGNNLSLSFLTKEQFYAQFVTVANDKAVEKIDTKFEWKINNNLLVGRVSFLFCSDDPELVSLLEVQHRKAKEKMFVESPPRIIVQYKDDVYANCVRFVEFVVGDDAKTIVDSLLQKLGLSPNSPIDPANAHGFVNLFIGHHLVGAGEGKKDFVRKNFDVIFKLK